MSCGVLVVSPASPLPDGAPGLGHELSELLRSAGHEVVECDAPADLCGARGVVEAAWVVLAGLDLLVVVGDGASDDVRDGAEDGAQDPAVPTLIGQRARELMTDRGLGGLVAHVRPDAPVTAAAACLLELLDPASPASGGVPCAGSSALRVEQVPARDGGSCGPGDPEAGRDDRWGSDRRAGRATATGRGPSLVRGPVARGPSRGPS